MPTITTAGVDELTLPNHPETKVWLKRRPNWGDQNRVQATALISRKEVGPDRYITDPEGFARFLAVRTLVMIHDWTVSDESGRRVPIAIEALEALDPADGEFLSTEAVKRYDGVTDTAPLGLNSEPSETTESPLPTPAPSESSASENS